MPALPILDVAIGLIFIFLLLSLMVTAANEMIASCLKRRPATLWRGIVRLLGGEHTAASVYAHPLIAALTDEPWLKQYRSALPQLRPSYIPSGTFVTALLDTMAQEGSIRSALDQRLARDPDDHLAKALIVFWNEAAGDADKFRRRLEEWFNNSMDRVSGWYKRRTQWIGFALAAMVAVSVNADTISIFRTLWREPAARAVVAAQAQQPPDGHFDRLHAELQGLPIPLGWEREEPRDALHRHFLGWLLTALAISLGAPFWFDVLSKVISIRSAGKAPPS